MRVPSLFPRPDSRMTASALPAPTTEQAATGNAWIPLAATGVLFAVLFARPAALLAGDWWNNPEAGHGLLLTPVAIWLAWKAKLRPGAQPNMRAGLSILVFAVLLRFASGLAAELFTMKVSMLFAVVGLVTCYWGFRQVLYWWLPFTLLALAVPLPELILNAVALPLQFKASQIGAALLRARDIPVLLSGNVIRVPGHELFVAEACSGLRSLTALLSLAILLGGMLLRSSMSRVLLVLIAIPIAVLINGFRIFLTGFLILFVSPDAADGFMHTTEGWAMFVIAFAILGVVAWGASAIERRFARPVAPVEETPDA
jgi:exosortase